MWSLLAFSFATGANAWNSQGSISGRRHENGGPPNFPPLEPTCSNETWTSGVSTPPKSRPFSFPPAITSTTSRSLVVEPTLPLATTTQPCTVSISTVFLTTIVTWIEVITHNLPASTITVDRTLPPTPTTIYQTATTFEPPSSACHSSGITPTPNAAFCNGENCGLTFEKGAIVHWELLTNRTPLVTHYLHSTCMAVVCNTTEFSQYYYRSATSCDLPPCPSNSLNCECNIVVGPIRLPDGRITSVTQTGPSGWNLNLGPIATARNIGRCGSTGAECLAAVTTTLFTPLVYTGSVEVVSPATYNNATEAEATHFLLPQLSNYFPKNDFLGMCTDVTLSIPTNTTTTTLWKRDDVATVGGDGVTTWPGCETLTDANAKRGLDVRQTLASDTTQLPICPSEKALSTTTLTETLIDSGTTSAAPSQPTSAATKKGPQQEWVTCILFLVIILM